MREEKEKARTETSTILQRSTTQKNSTQTEKEKSTDTEQENSTLQEKTQADSEKSSTTKETLGQQSGELSETTTNSELQASVQTNYSEQIQYISTQITGIQQIGILIAGLLIICALYRYINHLLR